MRRIMLRAGLVSAMAVLGLFAAGLPAGATTPTECDGTIGSETVTNGISVPDDAVCDLDGTTVVGPTTVGEGADLYATNASLHGDVTGGTNAFIDLLNSSVVGSIQIDDGEGVILDRGSTLGSMSANNTTFAFVLDAAINGNFNGRGTTEVLAYNGQFMGQFTGQDGGLADVVDSGVIGNVNIEYNEEGSFFCGNQVVGLTTFAGNGLGVQAGGTNVFGACDGNQFLSSVSFTDNTAEVEVSDNTINGFLDCYDNDSAPTGEGNTIHGFARGQCEPMSPFSVTDRLDADITVDDRYTGFDRVAERRAAADKLDRAEMSTTVQF